MYHKGIGPFPKPPTKAMKGLLKKSLISVAEAVSTTLTPEPVVISPWFNVIGEEMFAGLLKITVRWNCSGSSLCRPSNSDCSTFKG